MRSTLKRSSSFDIIAAVKSFWMRSINAILVCTNDRPPVSLPVLGLHYWMRKISASRNLL